MQLCKIIAASFIYIVAIIIEHYCVRIKELWTGETVDG